MKRSLKKVFLIAAIQTVIIFVVAKIRNLISVNASELLFGDGSEYFLCMYVAVPLMMIVFYMTLGFSTIYIFRTCPLWRDRSKGTRAGYIALLTFITGMMCLPFLSIIGDGMIYTILAHTNLQFFIQSSSFSHVYAALFIAMILPNFTENRKNVDQRERGTGG